MPEESKSKFSGNSEVVERYLDDRCRGTRAIYGDLMSFLGWINKRVYKWSRDPKLDPVTVDVIYNDLGGAHHD